MTILEMRAKSELAYSTPIQLGEQVDKADPNPSIRVDELGILASLASNTIAASVLINEFLKSTRLA